MVSVAATIFMVATQRSAAALKELLGESFQGIVTSDRFKAYLALPVERRQICWAHLKRNWVAFSELPDPLAAWGQQALAQIADLFTIWHRFKNGELDTVRFADRHAAGPDPTAPIVGSRSNSAPPQSPGVLR